MMIIKKGCFRKAPLLIVCNDLINDFLVAAAAASAFVAFPVVGMLP